MEFDAKLTKRLADINRLKEEEFAFTNASSAFVEMPQRALKELKPEAIGDCALCLEPMKVGQSIAQSLCFHRYHLSCLVAYYTTKNHKNCILCNV